MKAVKVFSDPKALELVADGTRRRIIYLLRARDYSVAQIAAELDMTPQAIYHHVRKMLDTGLIEVAKEERVEHFIETYYRAAAELFEFSYGEVSHMKMEAPKVKAILEALTKVGLTSDFDEETVAQYMDISQRMGALWGCCRPEVANRIAELDELDFITKQEAMKISSTLSMSDEQFDELQILERESRALLRKKIVQ